MFVFWDKNVWGTNKKCQLVGSLPNNKIPKLLQTYPFNLNPSIALSLRI